jgi:predicted RNA-binding Zn ribbon-like protein
MRRVESEPPAQGTAIPAGQEDLCLAFANTLSWRGSEQPSEKLSNPADLLRWLAENTGIPAEIVAAARDKLSEAGLARFFAGAIELRETIYGLFSAVAESGPVSDQDLALFNSGLAAMPPRHRLAVEADRFNWSVTGTGESLLLAPVLWSAADLLARGDRSRLRRCANERCLWLFMDQSKTGTRRWCDMNSCGNRAKARRHYLKTKAG